MSIELKKLRRKLYKPESEFEKRLETPEIFRAGEKRGKTSSGEWADIKKRELSSKQKKYLRLGAIYSGIAFFIIVSLMIWHGLTSFDKDKISLIIQGPEKIISGDQATYIVKYKNNTRLSLKDVKLVFRYPEKSMPSNTDDLTEIHNLPNLEPGQENQVDLSARIIGLKDEDKKVSAELSYQPGKISSHFISQTEFSTKIASVPLAINLDLPEKLVSGQSFDYSLKYSNQSETSFDNLQIRIDYPDGFNLVSSDPKPIEKDKIWQIGELTAKSQGEIIINGIIQGEKDELKSFKAQIGSFKDNQFTIYAETVDAFKISVSPLFVSQTINESSDYIAKAGDTLKYQINYQNTTNVGIKNVIISAKLEGQALDLTSLELDKGSFDGASQTIIWNAGNLQELAFLDHLQKGKIGFLIKIKKPLPIKKYADKNFVITSTVKIDSSEAPSTLKDIQIDGQSEAITKIASQLDIQAKGYFNDDLISNSGPIPPKIGQTTTYAIKWRLVNTANDLSNVKVKAFLPPNVQWKNKIVPANSDLKYNSQTGELIWQVGDLPSATGILLPVKQVAFQIAIIPSLAHLDSTMELIGQSTVTGYDNFVNSDLSDLGKIIDTDLPDDLSISQDGKVIE